MTLAQKNGKSGRKREKQTRYLSQAIQLEEAVNPHIIRATMTMVSLTIVTFIVWAGFANINEIARTPGEVVPQGYQQTVQHLEGGIVKTIDVAEGDVVEQGQLLLMLDDAGLAEDLARATSKQLSLDMQAERLRAFVENRKPDFTRFPEATVPMIADQMAFFDGMLASRTKEGSIINEQIIEKSQVIDSLDSELETERENLSIAKDIYDRRASLNKKGYASHMQLLEDRQQVNAIEGRIKSLENQRLVARTALREFEERYESLAARHRDEAYEKLAQVSAERAQNAEIVDKVEERIKRLSIRAPARGMVKGLALNTIGAIVQPGQTIMEIVPLDKKLEVAVKISPQDIGHLKIGQSVQVKFSSYDFSRYGFVTGRLEQISATTFAGENGERYYRGRIFLDRNYVGQDPANVALPGMTVMADVVTGEKTILQYLLKPIHISLKTAFTER